MSKENDKPMSLRRLRRWVSHIKPKGSIDAQAKRMLLDMIKEAQEKERERENNGIYFR